MSDNTLYLIPEEPNFIPDEESSDRAISLLRSFLEDLAEVEATVSDEIRFIDPGANFESVACPKCGSVITDSWQSFMDAANTSQFRNLAIITPCCGAESSLNDLVYKWSAGFAKYVLKANNPSIPDWLGQSQVVKLERILGCNLRQIKAHN